MLCLRGHRRDVVIPCGNLILQAVGEHSAPRGPPL